MNIDKVINPGSGEYGQVYCRITYEDGSGKLSITGVEGPKRNGDCRGGCGQIYANLSASVTEFADGWDRDKLDYFVTVWKRWHLNDMKAGCEHQRAMGWENKTIDPSKPLDVYGKHFPGQAQGTWNMLAWVTQKEHPDGLLSRPCPVCGYKYGSAWLFEAVPSGIINYLNDLPESKLNPAWV